ncbi:Actin-1 [Tritrichomonas foetus]|uniref:Actin-1 n=1 Tax=Tritrichomonas foetus TaxID=1144522 RepID=A0A1J4KJ69_9EUKA|nr:Actin-1 [Tritrichomonas foetus]|eukprot:OHT10984.1 Actin-1 [Tritrichomonas foetus]
MEVQSVVIDNGSCVIKAGFSGGQTPHTTFSSSIGFATYPLINSNSAGHKDYYISDEASERIGILSQKYPIHHSIIKDWDTMEKIWHHTFYNELRIDPVEHLYLFTSNVNVPASQNSKIAEIMFEKYKIPGIFFKPSDELTLLASGRTTGVVLESGDGVSSISAILEGYRIPETLQWTKMAGSSVTNFLIKKLQKRDLLLDNNKSDTIIARSIKETVGYISENYEEELKKFDEAASAKSTTYRYPDGQSLNIGNVSFKTPEFLFRPHVYGLEGKGLHQMLAETIQKCDIHIQLDLFKKICIGGGNTLFKGFDKRIELEMAKIVPEDTKVKIVSAKRRGFSAWIGAAMFSANQSFTEMAISKKTFEEEGSSIIERKCK